MLLTLPLGQSWDTQRSNTAEPLQARLLTCNEDRDALFAVRYQGFKDAGYDFDAPDGRYRDRFDDLPSTITVGVYFGRRPVGTLRVCFWRPGMQGPALPCEDVYPEVERVKSAARGPVVELSRMAVVHAAGPLARRTAIYAQLVRMGLLICLARDVHVTLVATHEQQRQFYERVFGFTLLAGPAPYPPGREPIILFGENFRQAKKRSILRNPFFRITEAEIAKVRKEFDNLPPYFTCR